MQNLLTLSILVSIILGAVQLILLLPVLPFIFALKYPGRAAGPP